MACENLTFTIVHKRQVTVDMDNYDRCDSWDNMDFRESSDNINVIFLFVQGLVIRLTEIYGGSWSSSFIYMMLVQVLKSGVVPVLYSNVGSSSCCWFFG